MQHQFNNNTYKKRKLANFLFLFSCFVIALILHKTFNIKIPCVFHKITSLYCPGCGITRAILSLIELDFYQAFRYNMLVVTLILLFIIYLLVCTINYIITKRFFIKIPNYIYVILLIITILFGILRNIEMFNVLAPTIV